MKKFNAFTLILFITFFSLNLGPVAFADDSQPAPERVDISVPDPIMLPTPPLPEPIIPEPAIPEPAIMPDPFMFPSTTPTEVPPIINPVSPMPIPPTPQMLNIPIIFPPYVDTQNKVLTLTGIADPNVMVNIIIMSPCPTNTEIICANGGNITSSPSGQWSYSVILTSAGNWRFIVNESNYISMSPQSAEFNFFINNNAFTSNPLDTFPTPPAPFEPSITPSLPTYPIVSMYTGPKLNTPTIDELEGSTRVSATDTTRLVRSTTPVFSGTADSNIPNLKVNLYISKKQDMIGPTGEKMWGAEFPFDTIVLNGNEQGNWNSHSLPVTDGEWRIYADEEMNISDNDNARTGRSEYFYFTVDTSTKDIVSDLGISSLSGENTNSPSASPSIVNNSTENNISSNKSTGTGHIINVIGSIISSGSNLQFFSIDKLNTTSTISKKSNKPANLLTASASDSNILNKNTGIIALLSLLSILVITSFYFRKTLIVKAKSIVLALF